MQIADKKTNVKNYTLQSQHINPKVACGTIKLKVQIKIGTDLTQKIKVLYLKIELLYLS
jgi:hypothetical protein